MILPLVLLGALTLYCEAGEKSSESDLVSTKKDSNGVSLRVLWVVSSFHIRNDASWGEDEARAMLFKPLDIDGKSITFDGKNCRDVVFTRDIVDTAEYLMERYQVSPETLGIEEKTIRVVKTTCSILGFDEYTHLRDRRLLVSIQGVLFFFAPTVNY